MKIVALVNQKGGVGKTTTAVNLAAGLAKKGKRVLAIDFDHQANLTRSFGIEAKRDQPIVLDWLVADEPSEIFQKVVRRSEREGVDVVPANPRLAEAEVVFKQYTGSELFLKSALADIKKKYDYVIIDTPPSLGLLVGNALTAANEVIIPLKAETLSMDGLTAMVRIIKDVKRRANPDIRLNGVLFTMLELKPSIMAEEVMEQVEDVLKQFEVIVYKSRIRRAVAQADAPSYGESIFLYKPDSIVAKGYEQFVSEFLGEI